MRHFALIALLSVPGLAACGKNPLGPSASNATPLAKSSLAAPLSSAPSASAPSASAPTSGALASPAAGAAVSTSPAAPAPSDGSDCVQEGENIDSQCGSQGEDGTPDGAPETPD